MGSYNIIGLMSGTSLDGLDLTYSHYHYSGNGEWKYQCMNTAFYPYNDELRKLISNCPSGSAWEMIKLDKDLAELWSEMILDFIQVNDLNVQEIDCIASHGQTIFHRPDIGITTQIGCGQTMATQTGIQVICDFRSKDVIHGGQGAPLVPIGDVLLFKNSFDGLINIGGFTNITILHHDVCAFDICPGNLPINKIVSQMGFTMDKDGALARSGTILPNVLASLNELSYYRLQPPKSLGTEWLMEEFYPLIEQIHGQVPDLLRTIVEHIALQISEICNKFEIKNILITGGGALNTFLIERIQSLSNGKIHIPDQTLISFKEALIFGLLGALRLADKPNCMKEVTGADHSVSGGTIYSP